MKRIILTIISMLVGAALLLGGGAFGSFMYQRSIPDFNDWISSSANVYKDDEDYLRVQELREEGYTINKPSFNYYDYDTSLSACYMEVQHACGDYALYVALRYRNKAKLDFEVDCKPKTLTINFTGTGWLEDGTEECLDRVYIFDIDGVGRNKLPKLLNKSEIYPEL